MPAVNNANSIMNKTTFFFIFVICSIAISCESNRNYILLKSIDGEQSVKVNAKEVKLFPGFLIDTTCLHTMIREYNYYDEDFPGILKETSDSSKFVIKIDKAYGNKENEIYVSLFGEINNRHIAKLYFYEIGQTKNYWKLEKAYIDLLEENNYKILVLNATLESMAFGASLYIRFPYNEDGLYDYDIVRYLKVESVFHLDTSEKVLEYF